jgi:hypothetical protein
MSEEPESLKFRFVAARYLESWVRFDRKTILGLSKRIDPSALKDLFTEYNVRRTIRGGAVSLDQFVRVVGAIPNRIRTPAEAVQIVTDAALELQRYNKGRGCLSAASKAIWMRSGHPVSILDRLASKGLEELGYSNSRANYKYYHEAWWRFFSKTKTSKYVADAQAWLQQSPYANRLVSCGACSKSDLEQWVLSERFANRVVDQRLVLRGRGDKIQPYEMARYF